MIEKFQNEPNQRWSQTKQTFEYDMFDLLVKMTSKQQTASDTGCFLFNISDALRQEWRYRYNPLNEREQKRMYYAPEGNSNGNVYPWVYYQLGGKNEQYVTYNGFVINDPVYFISNNEVCTNSNYPVNHLAFLYPVEYNTYGTGSLINLSYSSDENGMWRQDYKIFDHLGSVRAVLRKDVSGNSYVINGMYDYDPYGKQKPMTDGKDRLSFIGKEQDVESNLGDFGVRKYDENIGRFTSIDPLWEKYQGWSPYQYSMNNPVNMKDDNGLRAWEATNAWNNETKKGFSNFVKENFNKYIGVKLDCADLAVVLLIDYSKANSLPLSINTKNGTLDAQSDKFNTLEDYTKSVKDNFSTNDILSNTFKADASTKQEGDMKLMEYSQNNKTQKHTIIYFDVRKENSSVMYGNHIGSIATQVKKSSSDSPFSDGYHQNKNGNYYIKNLQGNNIILRWNILKP